MCQFYSLGLTGCLGIGQAFFKYATRKYGARHALTEETLLDDLGRPLNARFGPYWIFRSDDTPTMEVFLVQTMEASGPFGAKSIAEIVIDAVAPAVRNAVLDATGVTIDSIPFTPERVWRALHPQPKADL